MINELKDAIDKAGELPEKQQRLIAQFILREIEWDHAFQSHSERLSMLAAEALNDYKSGKTDPLDF